MTSALAATLLTALSLSLLSVGVPRSPGPPCCHWPWCDDGKLLIQKDVRGRAPWVCTAATSWPEAAPSSAAVDTVYDPEPAQQVCTGTPISYNLTIPNSGPYRPVGAESGEYLYCPAERWLNNLHRGATVLLYHPCAPLRQRLRLAALARACLSHFVLTAHPDLRPARLALVSWGRTLELSSDLTSAACDWLEAVAAGATGANPDDGIATRKYSLLLIRPVERRALPATQAHSDTTPSVRRCCEQSLSSSLAPGGGRGGGGGRRRGRQRREAVQNQEKTENTTVSPETSPSISTRSPHAARRSQSGLLRPGPERPQPGSGGPPDPPAPGSAAPDAGKATKPADTGTPAGVADQTGGGVVGQNSAEQRTASDLQDGRPESGERDALKQNRSQHTHSEEHRHTETPPSAPPPDPPGRTAAQDVLGVKGRTPRTDEAMWAAGALGFLLVLLALSVLHTRLYRQWRTTPSMYWHDPRRDYDSVADVIRKRLKVVDRRPRRKTFQPRRQECVLLPSSDEEDDTD